MRFGLFIYLFFYIGGWVATSLGFVKDNLIEKELFATFSYHTMRIYLFEHINT